MAHQSPVTPLFDADFPPPQSASATAASSPGSRTPFPPAAQPSPSYLSATASRPTKRNGLYDPQQGSCIWVNPVSGVQTLEQRFGPDSRSRIYSHLRQGIGHDDSDDPDIDDDDGGGDENDDGPGGNEHVPFFNVNITVNPENIPVSSPSITAVGTAHLMNFYDWENSTGNDDGDMSVDSDVDVNSNGTDGSTGQSPATQSGNSISLYESPIPRVARARVNLTALSQRYNLYFAVYQEKIHVYRPQPAPEILRGPLLVLRPRPTRAAHLLGGYINYNFHHQANHIITGDLGGIEIVLLAYDDGDVIAYYTHHIVKYLEYYSQREQPTWPCPEPKKPQPFFRETVGMSAWGLAIHSQSRLIAVSSNLAEVNVFAFALQPPKPTDPLQHKTQRLAVPTDDNSPTTWSGLSALELESLLRLRDRDWRILLPLGSSGSNIPSIDLIDDSNGNADKVIAVDINGYAWILDIWKVGSCPLKISPPESNRFDRGWGILVIPDEILLRTEKTPIPPKKSMLSRNSFPRTVRGFYLPNDNDPVAPPKNPMPMAYDTSVIESSSDNDSSMKPSYEQSRPDDEADSSSCDESNGADEDIEDVRLENDMRANHRNHGAHSAPFTYDPATMPRHWEVLVKRNHVSNGPDTINLKEDAKSNFHLGMVICPSIGLTWPNLSLLGLIRTLKNARYRLDRSKELPLYEFQSRPLLEAQDMAKRLFILRTFTVSAEFLSTDRDEPSFLCHNLLKPPSSLPFNLWDMDKDYHRCSLLQYVPEISLIIVGNMFGRVALLRPLKNIQLYTTSPAATPARQALSTEWILPLARDERARVRPPCCLLGIAVSPVPEPSAGQFGLLSAKKQNGTRKSRRWRLLLHYMDHTILQYYIEEKKPRSGKLSLRSVSGIKEL